MSVRLVAMFVLGGGYLTIAGRKAWFGAWAREGEMSVVVYGYAYAPV